jgi:hypothetical protein
MPQSGILYDIGDQPAADSLSLKLGQDVDAVDLFACVMFLDDQPAGVDAVYNDYLCVAEGMMFP